MDTASTPLRINRTAQQAQRLAEGVAEVWHNVAPTRSRIEILLGVVAGLALFPYRDQEAAIAHVAKNCSPQELLQGLREVYAYHWRLRPELVAMMVPLLGWLSEKRDEQDETDLGYAVRRVVDEAIRHGVLQLTGSSDPQVRSEVDVLSWLVMALRSRGARQGLGEYHTPPEVCALKARLMLQGQLPSAGASFGEPTAGSGGLCRALAQEMRELGGDPAVYRWYLTELDPVAAALAAVNAIVWGLGPEVVIACGDTLADPGVVARAEEARRERLRERDELVARLAVAEAVRKVQRLIAGTDRS